MKNARCIEDGAVYSADEFSCLESDCLEQKRRLLECPGCGGPAFFRHATHNGRASCFGARPHVEGCGLAAQDREDAQESLRNSGKRIIIDFKYGASAPTKLGGSAGHGFDHGHSGYRPDAPMYRRPSLILRDLIESPAFRGSDQPIEMDDHESLPARDFFVPIHTVTTQHLGQFRGYWGRLHNVGFSADRSTLWFNGTGLSNVSFCLSAKQLDAFNRRFIIRSEADLVDAYLLVFGTLRIGPNEKLYCVIDDIDRMALRLA